MDTIARKFVSEKSVSTSGRHIGRSKCEYVLASRLISIEKTFEIFVAFLCDKKIYKVKYQDWDPCGKEFGRFLTNHFTEVFFLRKNQKNSSKTSLSTICDAFEHRKIDISCALNWPQKLKLIVHELLA